MFKPVLLLAFVLALFLSPSSAEKATETSTEVALPRCRCICRTFPLMKRLVRRRCRRFAGLCRVRRCARNGRRGIRCCIIFKLVADETSSESTGATADVVAAPYPPLGGSCGGSNIVHNFFSALSLNDGSSLTRVKIAFCVANRDTGKRMFDEVVDDINRRFSSEDVKDLDAARTIVRQEAVAADAFALAYYNPV